MRRNYPLAALLLLSACSLNDAGLQQLNAGANAQAFASFTQCANQGDSNCINNLGLMYERGLVTGTPDLEAALAYYTLAARYGNSVAQQNLLKLGAPIPAADLYALHLQKLEEQRLAAEQIATAIAQAARSINPEPTVIVQNPSSYKATTDTRECTSDYQCGYGRLCVRPEGTFGKGRCVTPVNEFGVRTYEVPEPSVGPRDVAPCSFSTDCPVGFRCDKKSGQLFGLCIKK